MSCVSEATIQPVEEGVALITMSFTDEDGNSITPDNLAWQLMDKFGNIINDRDFDSGYFSGNTVLLSGDDLALQDDLDDGVRYLGIKGTYDSTYGTSLPLKDEYKFTICSLLNFPEE